MRAINVSVRPVLLAVLAASAPLALAAGCLLTHDVGALTVGSGHDGGADAPSGDEHDVASGACDAAGVDIALRARGSAADRELAFAEAGTQTRFENDLSGGPCPMNLDVGTKVPARAFVVQNASAGRAVLSAWVVCNAVGNDAFLTFYERSTPPSGDEDLRACAVWVSEGRGGKGSLMSPESADSPFCPGLLAAADAGLPLDPCQVAVVYAQQPHPEIDGSAPGAIHLVLQ